MTAAGRKTGLYGLIAALSLIALVVLPAYGATLAMAWVMVVFALTWNLQGGQMGYNSFGNIVFFGIGMYTAAVVKVGMHTDVAQHSTAAGAQVVKLSGQDFVISLALGMALSAVLAVALAVTLGSAMMGLRGHYFAIGTLGLGIAAGELAAGWDYIGAGSGMVPPLFPGELGDRRSFFYYVFFVIAVATFFTLKRIYSGRFGLAINAIRDDEDKAEAMGLHTTFYKTVSWSVSVFFLGLIGGGVGSLIGFIDPTDTAFAGATFGIWMVLMAILGGKGTIWGPVIGALVFHFTQENFWTFLLGWQRVALGLLIVVVVIFPPGAYLAGSGSNSPSASAIASTRRPWAKAPRKKRDGASRYNRRYQDIRRRDRQPRDQVGRTPR